MVTSAEEATKLAIAFIKRNQYIWPEAVRAYKKDTIWVVELEVGFIMKENIVVKINAENGEIESYDLKPE